MVVCRYSRMTKIAAVVVLFAVGLMLPTAASAQSWRACFEPGTATPTPEAYVAIREVVAASKAARAVTPASPWPTTILLGFSADGGEGTASDDLLQARRDAIELELMEAGVGRLALRWREDLDADHVGPSVCAALAVGEEGSPALWHLPPVFFDAGSAEITTLTRRVIRHAMIDYRPGATRVRISGYADTAGRSELNMELSRQRADAVRREMVRQGARYDDITIEAWGETLLIRSTADGVSEPLNRRVIIDMTWPRP